ncbi:DUF3502 domain-containing protein [Oscillospiraceae bacterium HV4-5-C5C]|nr:DUF3502 domain-containing protein [Oscillospiraceae bacterium HV4-5-C5C]
MKNRMIAASLTAAMLALPLAACSSGTGSAGTTTAAGSATTAADGSAVTTAGSATDGDDMTQAVNLVYYLWGDEGVANQDVLAKINEKLKADLNATLEIKYIGWSDVSTKYPLLFTSGESFDMTHASPTAAVSYFTLASQDVLVDITDDLDAVPTLKSTIPQETWDTTKYKDRIYGVPTLYSEFTPYGFAYRTDLLEKYGLSKIDSLDSMEAYMKAVVANEDFAPLNGNTADAVNLYRMFVGSTDQWLTAPGIPEDQLSLVATDASATDIIDPAFTDEFEAWAEKMKDWADQGFWPQDVMASQTSAKDNLLNGISAGYITHMPDWTGNYGAEETSLPGVYVDWWSPTVDNGKIVKKPGVDNSTAISVTSEHPIRALKVIEKFMTDESYYDLLQYGIEGREYEIVDGKVQKPASYNDQTDAYGVSAWSLRSDALNIPLASEDPVRYDLINEWKKTAIASPFAGFTFDPTNVSTELSSIANVNANLGTQLMLGKTQDDVKTAVENYRQQLKDAGVDKVIEEVKTQYEAFKSGN